MKKNRLRVFMTILATTMGCAFLIMLASVGFGLHKSLTEEMSKQQILTEVSVSGKEVNNEYLSITAKDLEKIKKVKNVDAVVARTYTNGQLEASFEERSAFVAAAITDMKEEIKAGMGLEKGRLPEQDQEMVVGYHFASQLLTKDEQKAQSDEKIKGYEGELLNKEVKLILTTFEGEKEVKKDFTFTIVGIKKEPSRDWQIDSNVYVGEGLRDSLIIPSNLPEDVEQPLYNEVNVYASTLETVDNVTKALKDEGFLVFSITEELENMNLFFTALKAGLIFVGTVAVLIASIGIFNTMTMAVTERTQEIGIMKAIGAQPNIIRRLFLMESAYIGILGSAIGVAIAYGISLLANTAIPAIISATTDSEGPMNITFSYIPVSLVVIAVGISVGVAMISGLRPAMKATSINVLSALRREI
jgi:acetoin utilization transport system permease protein